MAKRHEEALRRLLEDVADIGYAAESKEFFVRAYGKNQRRFTVAVQEYIESEWQDVSEETNSCFGGMEDVGILISELPKGSMILLLRDDLGLVKEDSLVYSIEEIEEQIQVVEGFKVKFFQNGKNVRGDKVSLTPYPYDRMAKSRVRVSEWIAKRIQSNYPEYDVKVFNGEELPVNGSETLGVVRDSYFEED